MTVARASVYPVIVHATVAYDAWNTRWNVGSATLTTVMSRIAMMAPSTTTPATFRTPRSSLSEGAAGAGLTVMRVTPQRGGRALFVPLRIRGGLTLTFSGCRNTAGTVDT